MEKQKPTPMLYHSIKESEYLVKVTFESNKELETGSGRFEPKIVVKTFYIEPNKVIQIPQPDQQGKGRGYKKTNLVRIEVYKKVD